MIDKRTWWLMVILLTGSFASLVYIVHTVRDLMARGAQVPGELTLLAGQLVLLTAFVSLVLTLKR